MCGVGSCDYAWRGGVEGCGGGLGGRGLELCEIGGQGRGQVGDVDGEDVGEERVRVMGGCNGSGGDVLL